MLRLSFNICSKTVFRNQSTTFKLPSRILIPKGFENVNACAKFSTNPDEKPKVKIGLNIGNTEHIYHGVLSRQIRAVKVFSLTSSIAGILLQPMLYEKSQELGGIGMTVAVCSMVGFFTFVTPLLLHLVTRKYVIDMEFDHETETYTASTISFFLYTKRVSMFGRYLQYRRIVYTFFLNSPFTN